MKTNLSEIEQSDAEQGETNHPQIEVNEPDLSELNLSNANLVETNLPEANRAETDLVWTNIDTTEAELPQTVLPSTNPAEIDLLPMEFTETMDSSSTSDPRIANSVMTEPIIIIDAVITDPVKTDTIMTDAPFGILRHSASTAHPLISTPDITNSPIGELVYSEIIKNCVDSECGMFCKSENYSTGGCFRGMCECTGQNIP